MKKPKHPAVLQEPVTELAGRIIGIIEAARSRVQAVVDAAMVYAYWEIGREIVEDEQRGERRAGYGKALIENLAKELTARHGKGFDRSNLWNMRGFYLAFPKVDALRRELSWTHYRQLLKIEEEQKRSFYEIECANGNWSTRELERQMNSMLFERLALSRDKEGVMALAREGQVLREPSDMVKDPYVLESLGLPQSELLYEKELESALLEHLQKFLLELGKGARARRSYAHPRLRNPHAPPAEAVITASSYQYSGFPRSPLLPRTSRQYRLARTTTPTAASTAAMPAS